MTDEDGASDLVTFTTVANSKDVILTLNSDPLSEGSIPEAEKKPYGMADEATKTIPLPPGFPELSGAILTVRATSDSNPVPEPSSLMLIGSGIAVLGFAARRRPESGAGRS